MAAGAMGRRTENDDADDGLPSQTRQQERDVSDIEDIANRTAAGIALAYRSGEAGAGGGDRMPARPHREGEGDNIFITVTADRARPKPGRREARYAAR